MKRSRKHHSVLIAKPLLSAMVGLFATGLMAVSVQAAEEGKSVRSDMRSSELRFVEVQGIKKPNSLEEGDASESIVTGALAPADASLLAGYNEWVPFVTRSPDQLDAGTCLYMSTTGIAEMFLARANPNMPIEFDGPLDLSERFTANIAGLRSFTSQVRNWKTDTIYIFNNPRSAVRNSSYRFTKGWYYDTQQGYVAAPVGAQGAEYGEAFNWVNQSSRVTDGFVGVPPLEREVLFRDPADDQWNVAVAPANIVDSIKEAMRRRNGIVQVIYNHMGYWHAVHIVGFDDEMDTQNCRFVNAFQRNIRNLAQQNATRAQQARDPNQAAIYRNRSVRQTRTADKIDQAWQSGGGCEPRGMFYVRDSIYGGDTEPTYVYDSSRPEGTGHYSKPIVLREYDWIRYLANHVQVIYLR